MTISEGHIGRGVKNNAIPDHAANMYFIEGVNEENMHVNGRLAKLAKKSHGRPNDFHPRRRHDNFNDIHSCTIVDDIYSLPNCTILSKKCIASE
jgi:hypothetical protein